MSVIKTIIVDDEYEAREGIKLLLQDDVEIEIVALCKNGVEAIDTLEQHAIDLVFLDIQMPIVNGFEVLNSVDKGRIPHVIFITAYDQFALKAFEVHAIDYILKPFTDARFYEGLARAKELINQKKHIDRQQKVQQIANQMTSKSIQDQLIVDTGVTEKRMVVKENGKISFVGFSEIVWIEAYDYYVKIHTENGMKMIRESMKKLHSRLPEDSFIRIHKSYIINKNYLSQIQRHANSELTLSLINGIELKVGRSYRDDVKSLT